MRDGTKRAGPCRHAQLLLAVAALLPCMAGAPAQSAGAGPGARGHPMPTVAVAGGEWHPGVRRLPRAAGMSRRLRGGAGPHREEGDADAQGQARAVGGSGLQTELAEEYLQNMPTGLNDWRHNFAASKPKVVFKIESAFRGRYSFDERKAMAERIRAAGTSVPVVAERLHDGIRLPETVKPKFSVPAGMSLDKFVAILREKLPWTDLYSRHSHIRLFVKQGAEMAVASSMGELHLLHRDTDGFLYLNYADSWRPDLGKGRQEAEALSPDELDRFLENRAQIFADEQVDDADADHVQAQFTSPALKAITVQQPLADAMILGKKRVEGRNFNTKMPKKGGMWIALHVGMYLRYVSLHSITNVGCVMMRHVDRAACRYLLTLRIVT